MAEYPTDTRNGNLRKYPVRHRPPHKPNQQSRAGRRTREIWTGALANHTDYGLAVAVVSLSSGGSRIAIALSKPAVSSSGPTVSSDRQATSSNLGRIDPPDEEVAFLKEKVTRTQRGFSWLLAGKVDSACDAFAGGGRVSNGWRPRRLIWNLADGADLYTAGP